MKRQLIISIALFFLLGAKGLFAQHEFSAYGGGSLSTLSYKVTTGQQKHGFGGHFGLGYQFLFAPKWGVGTGAELAFYNARFKMNNFHIDYNTFDRNGTPFEFRSTINDFKEKQRAMTLQIPLMLYHQSKKTDNNNRQYFGAVGGKIGIPLKGKYRATADLRNSGYYAYEDAIYDTWEFMGFGNFPSKKSNGDLDFKTTFFVSAEAGIKWNLKEKWLLYTGVYFDYGLNNIIEKQNVVSMPSLVEYNGTNPHTFAMNSIVNSQYILKGVAQVPQVFTDKLIPIAAGIKLKLVFGKSS